MLLVLLAAIGSASPATAAAISRTSTATVPLTLEQLSCGDAPELLTFSGSLRIVSHFTETENGRVLSSQQVIGRDLIAIGDSGTRYRVQFVNTSVSASSSLTSTTSFTLQFTLRGSGPNDDAVLRTVVHSTVTANGELVVDFSRNVSTRR